MTRSPRLFVASLLLLWGCDSPVFDPDVGGASMSLRVASDLTTISAAPDRYRIHLDGPSLLMVTGAPGETVVLEELTPGSYSVALEGLVGNAVETYGEQNGVSVIAGQNADVTVSLQSFVPQLLRLPTFVSQGGQLDVQFTSVPGATHYLVEWDDDLNFGSPESSQTNSTSVSVTIDAAGIYFVRVRAANRLGSQGRASSGEAVNVVDARSDVEVITVSAPTSAAVGGTISISSTTRNQGRAEAGAFRVGVYLSSNGTITTDDALLGSCLVSSLGSGSVASCDRTVTIPASLTPGTYFVGVIADDQDDLDEANEANNTSVATNATVAEIDEPDLAVTGLTAPPTGTAGGAISVTSTTRNQGTGEAGAFRVGVYLSTNTMITTDDLLLDSCSLTSLGVGNTSGCDRSLTIPGTVTPGTYYVGAVADDQTSVSESDETNNSRSATNATVVSARPTIDLAVMQISAPTHGTVGGTIAVTSTTENVGSEAAEAFRVGLYLSTDATVSTTGQEIGSCSVSALAAGESAACNIDVTIPASVAPGTYYVGAYADDQDAVTESEEANNSLVASNPTGLEVAAADLVVVDVTAPATGTIGGTVQITSSTENPGGTEAGAFRIALYLSTDATITTADVPLAWCPISSLAPGDDVSCSPSVTIPGSTAPGTYYVGAIADDQDEVKESNETNNALVASNPTVVGGTVDLTVTAVAAPPTGTIGSRISVAATTHNQGTTSSGAFRVGLYLSTDQVITTADRRVGTCSATSLAAGAAVPCSRNVTIPPSMAPGTYYVGGFADDQRALAESDETNNALAASNTTDLAAALPDLVVIGVTAPLTGTVGSSIQIKSTTENRGGTAAGGFRVGLYLSVDPVITAADQLVGTCSVSTLGVGGAIACDRTAAIPSSLPPGVYYVGAFADDQTAVAELDETNNTLTASNTIDLTATPTDLTVANVGAPATGTIGSTIQITSKMENLGGTAAGAFRTGLYLSADATITAADQLIGSCSETSLAGGGTVGCDVDAAIPTSLTPGTYYVGVFADDLGAVAESNETNNTLAASTTTVIATPADLVVTAAGGPAIGTIGSNIQITSTTENPGGTAAGAFRVGLYLSADATITTADQLLGSCSMSSLAVGGTVACDADVTIPGSVTPGAYWVGAFADDQDVVTESDEANKRACGVDPDRRGHAPRPRGRRRHGTADRDDRKKDPDHLDDRERWRDRSGRVPRGTLPVD